MSATVLIPTIAELRAALAEVRRRGETIGLVPTMGALHAGHLSLVERARAKCDRVVVTLFVNPIQFDRRDDLERYPRTLDADLAACRAAGADWLFAPSAAEMYPSPPLTFVDVADLTLGLCGAHRPGHFRGVATVVAKLLLIALPDRAYFGEKDYQQLAVVRRMTRDLNFPVEIVGAPTVREPDGLAMSSRNVRLGPAERRAALGLSRALAAAERALAQGERSAAALVDAARAVLDAEPLARTEYVEVVDPETLAPVERVEGEARMALAVWIGDVRLIDNTRLLPGG